MNCLGLLEERGKSKFKKPSFFDITKFTGDYVNGDIDELKTWIKEVHNIKLHT